MPRSTILVRCATLALLATLLPGCATVYTLVEDEHYDCPVYSGVREDASLIGIDSSSVFAVGAAGGNPGALVLLSVLAFFDLPLSLVADTVVLPYTAIVCATRPPRPNAPDDGPPEPAPPSDSPSPTRDP